MSMIFGEIRITRKAFLSYFQAFPMIYYTDVIQKLFYKKQQKEEIQYENF